MLLVPTRLTACDDTPVPGAPTTLYVRSGDVDLAYQIVGEGPLDFVFVPGWAWNLELAWDLEEIARFFERTSRFARTVIVEKRGVGLSDRVSDTPTLEERADDIRAVMDAAGLTRAAVGGWFDGGAMAAHFAATHPERVSALVVGNMAPRVGPTDGGTSTLDAAALDAIADRITNGWGEAKVLEVIAPSVAHDARVVTFWRRFERMSATPNAAAALFRWNASIDLRPVLPAIQAPTLVLHRSGIRLVPSDAARSFAGMIPGARFVEQPGADMYPFFGDCSALVDELEEFLTGAPPATETPLVLLTVVFTDIVGSTTRAAELGDVRWRDLLASHHREIRRLIARFEGREIDTAGDGFFATFPGPARAIRFACAARDAVRGLGLEIRAGVHTGEVERHDGEVTGLAVHVGARVVSLAGDGEVLVTSTVKELVLGSGIEFEDRGVHTLKGVPDDWRLFAVRA